MTLLRPRFWVHSMHTSPYMPSYHTVPSSAAQTPWPRFETTINYELQSSVLKSSLLLMKHNSLITENIFNIFLTSFLTWKCQISMSLDCLVLGYFILNNAVWVFAWIFFLKSSMNFDLEVCSHEFPTISEMTLYIFLSFCTAYLCEVVFSALAIINQNINFEKCWRCFTSCSIKHSANLILF